MEVTYGLIANLVKTKSLERALAPIVSQISLMIILKETNYVDQSEEESGRVEHITQCCDTVQQAVQKFIVIGQKQMIDSKDQILKTQMKSACESLDLCGSELTVCFHRYLAEITHKQNGDQMIQAAKDVLQAMLKVLLVSDDGTVRRLLGVVKLVQEKLTKINSVKAKHEFTPAFKEFTETVSLLVTMLKVREMELLGRDDKEWLAVVMNHLEKSVPSLEVSVETYLRYVDNPKAEAGKSSVVRQISTSLSNISAFLENKPISDKSSDVLENGHFVSRLSEVLQMLSEEKRNEALYDLEPYLAVIIGHSMAVAHFCLDVHRNIIIRSCHSILQVKGRLLKLHNLTKEKPDMERIRNDYNDICEMMMDELCDLEKNINLSILHLIVEIFKETTQPAEKLITSSQDAQKRNSEAMANDVAYFTDHADRMCQVALLAAGSSTNSLRVQEIRSSVYRLEKLDPEIVATVTAVVQHPSDTATFEHLKLFIKNWKLELSTLVSILDNMSDPTIFLDLSEKRTKESISACKSSLHLTDLVNFKHNLRNILRYTKRIYDRCNNIIEDHTDPIFRNGFFVFCDKLQTARVEASEAGNNLIVDFTKPALQDTMVRRLNILDDCVSNMKKGLSSDYHLPLTHPDRLNARKPKKTSKKKGNKMAPLPPGTHPSNPDAKKSSRTNLSGKSSGELDKGKENQTPPPENVQVPVIVTTSQEETQILGPAGTVPAGQANHNHQQIPQSSKVPRPVVTENLLQVPQSSRVPHNHLQVPQSSKVPRPLLPDNLSDRFQDFNNPSVAHPRNSVGAHSTGLQPASSELPPHSNVYSNDIASKHGNFEDSPNEWNQFNGNFPKQENQFNGNQFNGNFPKEGNQFNGDLPKQENQFNGNTFSFPNTLVFHRNPKLPHNGDAFSHIGVHKPKYQESSSTFSSSDDSRRPMPVKPKRKALSRKLPTPPAPSSQTSEDDHPVSIKPRSTRSGESGLPKRQQSGEVSLNPPRDSDVKRPVILAETKEQLRMKSQMKNFVSAAVNRERSELDVQTADILRLTNHIVECSCNLVKHCTKLERKKQMMELHREVEELAPKMVEEARYVSAGDSEALEELTRLTEEWSAKYEKLRILVDVSVDKWSKFTYRISQSLQDKDQESCKVQLHKLDKERQCMIDLIEVATTLPFPSSSKEDILEYLSEQGKDMENLTATITTTSNIILDSGSSSEDNENELEELCREWNVCMTCMTCELETLTDGIIAIGSDMIAGLGEITTFSTPKIKQKLMKQTEFFKELILMASHGDSETEDKVNDLIFDLSHIPEEFSVDDISAKLRNSDIYKRLTTNVIICKWILKGLQSVRTISSATEGYTDIIDDLLETIKEEGMTDNQAKKKVKDFQKTISSMREKILQGIVLSPDLHHRGVVRKCLDDLTDVLPPLVDAIIQSKDDQDNSMKVTIWPLKQKFGARMKRIVLTLEKMTEIKPRLLYEIRKALRQTTDETTQSTSLSYSSPSTNSSRARHNFSSPRQQLDLTGSRNMSFSMKALQPFYENMMSPGKSLHLPARLREGQTSTPKTAGNESFDRRKITLDLKNNVNFIEKQIERWNENNNPVVIVTRELTDHVTNMVKYCVGEGTIANLDEMIEVASRVVQCGVKLRDFAVTVANLAIDSSHTDDLILITNQISASCHQLKMIAKVFISATRNHQSERILTRNARDLMQGVRDMFTLAEIICLKGLSMTGDKTREEMDALALLKSWQRRLLEQRQEEFENSQIDELGLRRVEMYRPPRLSDLLDNTTYYV